jgi:hypothetical protein
MSDRSCDRMIDTEVPSCHLGLHFPLECCTCLPPRYLPDERRWNSHRENLWRTYVLDKKANIGIDYEIPELTCYKEGDK